MDQTLYLALDQGGHASRAMVFNGGGQVVAEAAQGISVSRPQPSRVEHDPEEMVASLRGAAQRALQSLGPRAVHVAAAGLATQRSNVVCWDRESGEALTPILSWQDRRTAQWIRQFSAHEESIHRKTGLFLTAHYGASKLNWCFEHYPAVRAAHAAGRLAYGPMASFLAYRLLEERPLLIDPANAARTLLWNFHTGDWDDELLALFSIQRDALPRSVATHYRYGTLACAGHDIPFTILTGDQSAALFAFGRPQPDTAYVNMGTGAFVQRATGDNPGYAERLLTGIVLRDARQMLYVLEGTVNGAGSALDQIEAELGIDPRDAAALAPTWLAEAREPPLFLNGISGLGAPYWVPDFPSRFIGEGGNAEKIVAVLESIVFLILANLHEQHRYAPPAQHVLVTGGLGVLDGLCQRLADLAGIPVHRPVECEATARGTAYLLAGCPAHWPQAGQGEWFYPVPNPALTERHARWQAALHEALRAHGAAWPA